MKGFIAKSLTMPALVGGLAAASGCATNGKCLDICYPDRYEYAARQELNSAFAPQVQNGDILYHTMWNYFFDSGRDELNNSGRDHLDGLVRRRPFPSGRIYLATARDLTYDSLNPDKYAEQRRDLDEKRAATIQKYMQAQTAGRPMQFEVVIHDPSEVGQHAYTVNRAVLLGQNTSSGSVSGGSSASTAGQGQSGSGNATGMGGQSGSGSGGASSSGSSGGNSGGGH